MLMRRRVVLRGPGSTWRTVVTTVALVAGVTTSVLAVPGRSLASPTPPTFTLAVGVTPEPGCSISVVELPGAPATVLTGDATCHVTLPTNLTYPYESFVGYALSATPGAALLVNGATVAANSTVLAVWSPVQTVVGLANLASPPTSSLDRVACVSATWCLVAGSDLTKVNLSGGDAFLETDVNGLLQPATALTFPAARRNPSPSVTVSSVSCVPSGACEIAGNYRAQPVGLRSFITRRAPTGQLTSRPVDLPATWTSTSFQTVGPSACDPSARCLAVGVVTDARGADHAYYVVTTPTGQSRSVVLHFARGVEARLTRELFTAVSCDPTGVTCLAVGTFLNARGRMQSMSLTFTHMVAGPVHVLAATAFAASSVDCPTAQVCVAMGGVGLGSQNTAPASQTWRHGIWSKVARVPFPVGMLRASYAVAVPTATGCLSATQCEMVGSYFDAQGYVDAFTAEWHDGAWALAVPLQLAEGATPSPVSSGHRVRVTAMSCTPTACALVGEYTTSSGAVVAFTAGSHRWTVLAWTAGRPLAALPSVSAGAPDSQLNDVSCAPGATQCLAAGSTGPNSSGGVGEAVAVSLANG